MDAYGSTSLFSALPTDDNDATSRRYLNGLSTTALSGGGCGNREEKQLILDKLETILDITDSVTNANSFMMMTINRCIDYNKTIYGLKLIPRMECCLLYDTMLFPINCLKSISNKVHIDMLPFTTAASTMAALTAATASSSLQSILATLSIVPACDSGSLDSVDMEGMGGSGQKALLGVCNGLVTLESNIAILTDKQWLQENLLCLLGNAVKYSNQQYSHLHNGEEVSPDVHDDSRNVTLRVSLIPSASYPIGGVADHVNDVIHESSTKFTNGKSGSSTKLQIVGKPGEDIHPKTDVMMDMSDLDSTKMLPDGIVDAPGAALNARNKNASGRIIPLAGSMSSLISPQDSERIGAPGAVMDLSALEAGLNVGATTGTAPPKTETANMMPPASSRVSGDSLATPLSSGLRTCTQQQAATTGLNLTSSSFYLLFEVEDHGPGIPTHEVDSIFKEPRQAARLTGGTGLGLYSLARRIETLQGDYGVRRRRDGKQGSCFWFTIPFHPSNANQTCNTGMGGTMSSTMAATYLSPYQQQRKMSLSSSKTTTSNAPNGLAISGLNRQMSFSQYAIATSRRGSRTSNTGNPSVNNSRRPSNSVAAVGSQVSGNGEGDNMSQNVEDNLVVPFPGPLTFATPRDNTNEHDKLISLSPTVADTMKNMPGHTRKRTTSDSSGSSDGSSDERARNNATLAKSPSNLTQSQSQPPVTGRRDSRVGSHQMQMQEIEKEREREQEKESQKRRLSLGPVSTIGLSTNPTTIISPTVSNSNSLLQNQRNKLHVLLVDDSAVILKMASMLLQRHGHIVYTAENGQEAVTFMRKLLDNRKKSVTLNNNIDSSNNNNGIIVDNSNNVMIVDVILMDFQMPIMLGIDAIRVIRELEYEFNQSRCLNMLAIGGVNPNDNSGFGASGSGKGVPKVGSRDRDDENLTPNSPTSHVEGSLEKTASQSSFPADHGPSASNNAAASTTGVAMFPPVQPHKIIGFSAKSDHEEIQSGFAVGMDAFMPKPFTIQMFYEIVDELDRNAIAKQQQEQEQLLLQQQ